MHGPAWRTRHRRRRRSTFALPAHVGTRRRRRSGRRQPSPASSARRSGDYGGAGPDRRAQSVPTCPQAVAGRRIAYAGVEPILFPGSIRDNLVYGLRHDPLGEPDEDPSETHAPDRRGAAHRQSGREHRGDHWIDYDAGGRRRTRTSSTASSSISSTRSASSEDIYRFGLSGRVDPEKHPELAGRLIEARHRLRETLAAERHGRSRRAVRCRALQPPGDGRRKSPVRRADLAGPDRARPRRARPASARRSKAEGIADELVAHGRADRRDDDRDLPRPAARASAVRAVLVHRRRRAAGIRGHPPPAGAPQRRGLSGATTGRGFLALPLAYIEPRHRLGLLDDELEARARQGPPRRARAARARARSRRRVLRRREGLRRGAAARTTSSSAASTTASPTRRRGSRRRSRPSSTSSACGPDIERVGLDRIRSDRPGGS